MTQHHQSPEWFRFTRRARPMIAAMLPLPCVDCGRPVTAEQSWHVGHIIAATHGGEISMENAGPSHVRCNTRAGGAMGAAITNRGRRLEQDIRPW